MPGLPDGVVFVHDHQNLSGNGNPGCGCMILAWDDGNCQGGWCGETYFLPGQLAEDVTWFLPVLNPIVPYLNTKRERYHVSFLKAKLKKKESQVIEAVRKTLDELEQTMDVE